MATPAFRSETQQTAEDDIEPPKPREMPGWMITTISLVVIIAVWQIFGQDINPIFGSYPSAIAIAFWGLLVSGELPTALMTSMQAFAVGFALSIVIGVPLGLIIGRSRILENAVGVYITAGNAMPLVAFVPLLILWFGLGFMVKAAIVFLMSVFPICINTWLGVRAVPKTLIEVGRALVAPNSVIIRRIVLPATLPYIMTGIKLAVGRAVVAMVIAEFFTAISGLGGIIINSANNFDTATMFVPIFVLMILATLLNGLVSLVERWVAPWQYELTDRN
ncbi:ABC transporter permease [Rhizobium sp. P32RR-XVIII]|uniref:ABC transporter permease n=1 Tax=Rhizobium sp. P32RR-XVIII TaxID=2726738 RepID=UPI00145691B3|nr:ABC transporter permease [Rhizobium sp. P32RR-XVIII]NLS06874.1 ABC transporter permease [Rhizobium sp. P32RR-XVIII]